MYVGTQPGLSAIGDSGGSGASFMGGAVLTAAVLGVALIVALKMFPPSASKPSRKWVSGAWRSIDYEEWPRGFPKRERGRRG